MNNINWTLAKAATMKRYLFTILVSIFIPFQCGAQDNTHLEKLKRYAEQGYDWFQYELGKYYLEVCNDFHKASFWMEKAAEQGDAEIQTYVGDFHYFKNWNDRKRCVYWYERAAEQGELRAQRTLGFLYYNGDGTEVPRNYKKAFYWYQKAATQGDWESQDRIWRMYFSGIGTHKNKQSSDYWLKKSKDENNPSYQVYQGLRFKADKNYLQALSCFKKAAQLGYAIAQVNLGNMYLDGIGVENDTIKAIYWYEKAAQQNHSCATYKLRKIERDIAESYLTKELATIELAGLASETTEREVTLRAGIKSDSYISDVRVMLNGNVVEPADRGANVVKNDGNDRTIIRKLILREGSNTIKVIAKNDGGEATAERTIVYRVKNLPILEWRNDIVSVGSSSYHLQLGVRTKSGIVSRMVMLNGKRIDEADRGANSVRNDGYDMVIDRYLMLSEGSNVIKVSVTNAEGTATAERLVTYTKPTPTERRIALVIGNATYNNPCFPNLRNPLNDAKAMYNKFKTLGFDLMPILLNAGRTKMWNAIEEFVDSIEKGNYEVALIYYSGHGLSPDGGANYLIPTDASIKYVDEIKRDGLNSQTDLIAKLEKKKCRVKIALLDCCNNCNVPERGVKNAANLGGMAMMRPPHGISILHAAQPRRTAFDGNSSNSPFVEAFLECADKYADEPWQTFITQVTNLVDTKTKGEQIPYPEGQIRGKFFYLNPNHK